MKACTAAVTCSRSRALASATRGRLEALVGTAQEGAGPAQLDVVGEAFCAGRSWWGREREKSHVGGPEGKVRREREWEADNGPKATKVVSLLPQLPPGILGMG